MSNSGGTNLIDSPPRRFPEAERHPESVWTILDSPPYDGEEIRSAISPASPNWKATSHSSPEGIADAEFQFDSVFALASDHDPPVSPRFASSSHARDRWAVSDSSSSFHTNDEQTISFPSVVCRQDGICPDVPQTAVNDCEEAIEFCSSLEQHGLPPPPTTSVGQLIFQELRECESGCHQADLGPLRVHNQRPMSLDGRGRQHLRLKNSFNRRTKSQGTLLDAEHLGVCEEPWEEAPKLVTNNSEPYTHLQASASASSSAIERPVNANKPAEKKSASKSAKKWAFKDFLRRTVPSSKADAHYINKTLGAQFSVKSFFSSSKHTCSTEASDLAPPLNVDSNQPTLTNAKLQPSQPSRSSSPHSESTHGSTHTKHPVEVSSKAQKPSIPSRVSTPSSPRSPLLSYVAHYKQQKAKSQELGRKTFLPYRQSLLSCLGANKPVPRGNLVW